MDGAITSYFDSSIVAPEHIVSGPDGNLWFTSSVAQGLWRMMPGGDVDHVDDPAIGRVRSIVAEPHGIWFTNDTGGPRAGPDVPTSNPFCGHITWLTDNGIATGHADGTYRPAPPSPAAPWPTAQRADGARSRAAAAR